MKKTIYNNAFTRFTDKEFDEKYALISHAIQLGDTINAKKYREILKENGIDASDLPSAELFNKDNKIELVPESNHWGASVFSRVNGMNPQRKRIS